MDFILNLFKRKEPEKQEPYLFIYPSLWREYKIASYTGSITDNRFKDWADFRIVPKMSVVPTNMASPFLSSDYLPSLDPTLRALPFIGKNSKPSIYKWCVQTFKPEDDCAVRKFLENRGWELTSGLLPVSPYEIADIERIAHFGWPKWEEKIIAEKKAEEDRSCVDNTGYYY